MSGVVDLEMSNPQQGAAEAASVGNKRVGGSQSALQMAGLLLGRDVQINPSAMGHIPLSFEANNSTCPMQGRTG